MNDLNTSFSPFCSTKASPNLSLTNEPSRPTSYTPRERPRRAEPSFTRTHPAARKPRLPTPPEHVFTLASSDHAIEVANHGTQGRQAEKSLEKKGWLFDFYPGRDFWGNFECSSELGTSKNRYPEAGFVEPTTAFRDDEGAVLEVAEDLFSDEELSSEAVRSLKNPASIWGPKVSDQVGVSRVLPRASDDAF